jgi:copper resistance protein C
MDLRRTFAALLLAGMALVATAPPAMAHTKLVRSDPAEGASLQTAPQQIQLTFAESVRLGPDPITVTGPDGSRWSVGQVSVAGPVVTAPVQPTGPAGPYTIDYRIVSSDGDQVRGAVRFALANAATPSTTAAPTTTSPTPPATAQPNPNAQQPPVRPASDNGVPVWAWIIGAVVLVGVGLFIALRFARPSRSGSGRE